MSVWSDRADLLQLIFTRRDEYVRIFLAEAERRPNLQPAANPDPEGSAIREKQKIMFAGTDTAYDLAKKYKLKTAWGPDILSDPLVSIPKG